MKAFFNQSIYTSFNLGALVLRLVLAIVLFAHGAQSMLGWFGGPGFTNTMAYLTTIEQLPYIVAVSVISLQFFGSLLLMFGVLTRFVSLAILGMFLGMIMAHLDHGFFMNWSGTNVGEGYEYHILVIGFCIALFFQGGGTASVDRMLTMKRIPS